MPFEPRHLRTFTLSVVFLLSIIGQALAASSSPANDMARLLAGLAPGSDSPVAKLAAHKAWQSHARRFDKAWANLEQRQLAKIRDWTHSALVKRQPVVFYTFSGPDFLYADALLPGASTYVLSGLEPVGRIPTPDGLERASLSSELYQLESSLNSVLSFSFFRTKEMKVKLRSRYLDGTLPIMLVFLSRANKTVHDVELIGLDAEGGVHPAGEPGLSKAAPGVKISFSDAGSDEKKTLYYFSTNLDNDGVKQSGFFAFCRKLGQGDSLVKSASYLMHQNHFSQVREFLLANSATLIEDDSGIPVHHFDPARWNLQPYGAYLGPIGLFPNSYQVKLRKLFQDNRKPLPFGIGYRYHPRESNLLVAIRKEP